MLLQSLEARIIKLDWCCSQADGIRQGGQQPFKAALNILNEYNQNIKPLWTARVDCYRDALPYLREVHDRVQRLGGQVAYCPLASSCKGVYVPA